MLLPMPMGEPWAAHRCLAAASTRNVVRGYRSGTNSPGQGATRALVLNRSAQLAVLGTAQVWVRCVSARHFCVFKTRGHRRGCQRA